MNNLLQYLAESSLALLLFYVVYVLLLSRQTCFAFNRFYLLAALLFSFIIPFLELPAWRPAEPELQSDITLIQVQSADIIYQTYLVQAAEVEATNYWFWLYSIYVSGLIIAGILFCRHFLKLYTFIYSHSAEGYYWQKIKIIPTNGEISTFSFFKYILLDNSQPLTPTQKELILRHEQAHLAQKHTYDIIYIKLLTIIFWFNPLLYLYKKALESTHEYLADAQVLQEEDSEAYAALLVQQVFHKTGFSLVNFFHIHKSLTLKRLAMMKKMKPTSAFIRPLLILPMVCAIALVFASNQPVSLPEMKLDTLSKKQITRISGFSSEDRGSSSSQLVANASDDISEPAFQNGNDQLYRFLLQNLKFKPEAFGKAYVWAKIVDLKIDAEGNPEVASAENGDLISQEISRVVNLMPRWIPAYQDGKGLPSRYELHFLIDRKSNHSVIASNKVAKKGSSNSEGIPTFSSDIIHLGLNPASGIPANFLDREPIVAGDITEPSFPGGKVAMENYFKENVNLTKILEIILANEKGFALGSGIHIKIDHKGNIAKLSQDNIFWNGPNSYINAIGKNLILELISLVNKMPRWEPAKKDGKNIDSEFSLNYALLYPSEPVKSQKRTQIYSINPKGEIIFESDKIYFLIPAKPSLIKNDKANSKVLSDINPPKFPGGKVALRNFLKQNTKYPAGALKNKITGQAIIQATIDEEGNVGNLKTLQTDNALFEQEAIRVLKELPRWEPATKDGKAIPVNLAFPFVFGIESNKNLATLKVPENKTQFILQDAFAVVGYSKLIGGKTVVQKSTLPTSKTKATASSIKTHIVFTVAEKPAVFKGGEVALQKFIRSNLKYPAEALRQRIEGTVIVEFIVDPKGLVYDAKVVKSAGPGLDEEALRVVNLMPDFEPAKQNNKPVAYKYTLPLKFSLMSPNNAVPQKPQESITQKSTEDLVNSDKIFTFVEQQASFPGGDVAMNKFMKENLKYPVAAKQNKEQGLVVVQFMVNKLGKISNPKVVKSLGKEFDEEAIRVVNQMPDFMPAKQNGVPVNFNYTLPIRFGL